MDKYVTKHILILNLILLAILLIAHGALNSYGIMLDQTILKEMEHFDEKVPMHELISMQKLAFRLWNGYYIVLGGQLLIIVFAYVKKCKRKDYSRPPDE